MKPILCIPVRAKTLKNFQQQIKKVLPHADIIEIWLDYLVKKDLLKLQKDFSAWKIFQPSRTARLPRGTSKNSLLFVNKGRQEKGLWKGSEADRIKLLMQAAKAGAKYIDIGIHTKRALIKKLRQSLSLQAQRLQTKVIISYHNFKTTPSLSTLWKILKKAKKLGADIVKIVPTAKKNHDNQTVLQLLKKAHEAKIPLITFCMGKKGQPSRISALTNGSYLNYVAFNEKTKTAPGQLTLHEAKNI